MLLLPSPAVADDRPKLALENRALSAELDLSKGTKVYLVVDLGAGRADLKVKGMTLRTFPIRDWDLLGDPPPAVPSALATKSTFQPPQRPELKPEGAESEEPSSGTKAPGATEPAAPSSPPDLQALELQDMPTEYTLELADGTRIAVKNRPHNLGSRVSWLWFTLRWRVRESFRVLRGGGKPVTAVKLVLDEADARALYWAFPEGVMALVVPTVR